MNLRAGYPFWLVKNGLPFNYPKLEQALKTDVIVLGGGISGALTAYYLNKEGCDCTVIDARTIGLGSTCASTSLLQYEIDTPLFKLEKMVGLSNAVRSYQLCVDAIDEIGALSKKIKFDGFVNRKSLYYAAYKKDVSFLKKEFSIRKEHGFDVSYLEENEIIKQFGFNSSTAILSNHGAEMDAYAFTHTLHQNSLKNGVKIFDRTPIIKIKHHKNGVSLVTQDGIKIEAKKIVYATGYEVVEFIDKKIVKLNSTYALVSEQTNEETVFWKENALMWNTADPYLYMRTTNDKRIIVGGRDEEFYNPTKRDKLIEIKKKQLVKDFNHVFPNIELKPEFSWCGTFGSTKDGLPFIGAYQKLPNSFFALGFGGNGITFSLTAAKILADLVTGKSNKDANIFSFERV